MWQEYMATTNWATPSGRVLYKDTDPNAKPPEYERTALLDQWTEHAAKRRGIITVQAQTQPQEKEETPEELNMLIYGVSNTDRLQKEV